MRISFFLIIWSSLCLSFTKGSGSEFIFSSNGKSIPLNIYFTDIQDKSISVEFHFAANEMFMKNMWQQFELTRDEAEIKIQAGYLKLGKEKDIEIMTHGHFGINNERGVEINQFLFSKKARINENFISDEIVEIPAGSVIAKHYRKNKNGQIVDFWIADSVKPIGLVKLVSESKKYPSQNYSIELASLLKNVAAEIDPKKAKKMSKNSENILKFSLQKK